MSPMTASASSPAQEIVGIAAGFSAAGARSLDLDRHLAERSTAESPTSLPLDFADGEFDLIHSMHAFARLRGEWPRWLAEAHRLLREGGLLIVAIPAGEAEGPAPGTREWVALRRRVDGGAGSEAADAGERGGLVTLFEQLDSEALRALDGVRESFDRELGRKAFRIAELEMDEEPTPATWAFGERVAATYEASLSWRVTRPLRAAKRLANRR